MAIRRRGSSWQVRVRPFEDRSFPTKDAAETYELNQKLKVKLGELYQETTTLFGDEIDEHLERRCSRKTLRPATIAFNERGAAPWKPLRNVPLSSLRRAAVENHITKRAKLAPVAARNELQLAKAVLREAASRGQTVDRGILEIPAIQSEPKEGRALTLDELADIAVWMPERVGRIVTFVGLVGLRFSEAVGLTDAMLNLDNAELLIPRGLNKSRRTKRIPLSSYETKLLREQLLARPAGSRFVFANAKGGMYTKTGFRSIWAPALKKAKQVGFKFHWLRHTAISLMAQAGMPVEMIALRVGHSDGGALIFKRYRHLFPSEVTRAVALMDAFVTAPRGREVVTHAV